ncbi:MAG: OmpH family outer membrane protein [Bacteroidia bacterium]|nr:OmpH family outer membrane protein [Bacteroidia bacterium]
MKTIKALAAFVLLAVTQVHAQDYWTRIPAFSNKPYYENDEFMNKLEAYREEIAAKIDAEKQKIQQKMDAMSDQEKMQMAMKASTRYQTMKPEEIMKMQQESQEIMALQTQVQQQATDFENRFNEIQKAMDDELNKTLGPIEAEYNKLPDGEGTPSWAIEKGKQLYTQYNQKYEAICAKYITGTNALFVKWLLEYKTYLIQTNLPFQLKWMAYQSSQTGMAITTNAAIEMDVVKTYLEHCKTVFNYRKPSPR